jgi:hypothetical protein
MREMAQGDQGGNLRRWVLISLGLAIFAVRANRARQVYREEVSSGSKPIEGVGTAVAAFVGLTP